MSVVPGGSHDIRLASDATAAPTTEVELILAQDENGAKRWSEFRAQPFPPRTSEGPLQWTHKDPRVDHVQAQVGWRGGGLQLHYSAEEPDRYTQADGCDARWGPVTLGMQRNLADFLLRNGGAEQAATTGWTAGTGVTLTSSTSNARTGSRSFSSVGGTAAAAQSLFSQALTNPTVYQGREITVIAYLRRTVGSTAGILLRVADNVGSTDSATVTASTYTYVSVVRTIDAAATSVTIDIRSSADPSGHTFFVDDIQIIPTGGVVWAGIAETADALYAACGRCVLQWNEANDVWNAVYIHASAVTSAIVNYDANTVVAFGAGASYIYGTGTTWTVSTRVDPADKAVYFTVSRNVIWKSGPAAGDTTNYRVYSSSSVINGGAAWSAAYVVGSSDRAITALYSLVDTLLVGKEDGLHYYLRTYEDGASADLFKNATNEFAGFPHADNFARGAEWHGRLFLSASLQSFFAVDGRTFSIDDLSSLFFHPEISTMGGRPWAMAADPAQLWLLVNTPTADTSESKTTWLMSMTAVDSPPHVLQTVPIGDINRLSVNGGYLYGLGRLYNADLAGYTAASYRWTLPTDNIAPAYASSPVIQSSGTFDLPQFGFDMPDTPKANLAMTFIVENTNANRTIAAAFGLNGAAPSTTSLGTLNGTGRVQTLYFNTISVPETNAIGNILQPRLTFSTNDTTSPRLHAAALHSAIRPERFRVWECFVWIGEGLLLNNQNIEPVSKASIVDDLDTLERQVYPIVFQHDFDQDGTVTTIRVHLLDASRQPADTGQIKESMELWRLLIQEADVS